MGIKGLTDQVSGIVGGGSQVRIGYIQKGTRQTDRSGTVKSMTDLDYFRFRPTAPEPGPYLQAWARAYGDQPRLIPDVRIPSSLAGNFDIEATAWLTASAHGKKGSLFLARSDGSNLVQARDPESGKMDKWGPNAGPDHDSMTGLDKDGRPCFVWQDKLYPWAKSMMIDLVLPDLNRELLQAGIGTYGVVTFVTRAANDIPVIISNYYAILQDLASLYVDPLDAAAFERQLRYIPLRDLPLSLERYEGSITTPGWGDRAGVRVTGKRWLVRLSLNRDFAAAVERARAQRTSALMGLIADGAQLGLKAGPSQRTDAQLEEAKADLFDNEITLPERPEDQRTAEEWAELVEDQGAEEEELEEDQILEAELVQEEAAGWRPLDLGQGGAVVPPGWASGRCGDPRCKVILVAPRAWASDHPGPLCPKHAPGAGQDGPGANEPAPPVPAPPSAQAAPAGRDFAEEALGASGRDQFCKLFYEWDQSGSVAGFDHAKKLYRSMIGLFNHKTKDLAWRALTQWAQLVADGSDPNETAVKIAAQYRSDRAQSLAEEE